MDRVSEDPSALLKGAATRAPNEVAASLTRVLERAGAASSEPEAREADTAAVRALGEAIRLDAVLEGIEPAGLAELLGRATSRLRAGADDREARDLVWAVLDVVRRPSVLRRLEASEIEPWARLILDAVEASQYTVGALFRQRVQLYGSKVLFRLASAGGSRNVTWRQAGARVDMLTRGLLGLDPSGEPGPVAILSENRLEMALVDLACLVAGIRNVMVPATATDSDVAYILRHAGVRTAIVADARQLRKVVANRDAMPELRHVVSMNERPARDGVIPWPTLLAAGERIREEQVAERAAAVRIGDSATVMYTSGTTGVPKGIEFTQRNLVFKRFARALALPEIGEDDVFLCFLPLFHTFGRFLELLGCVFWGATYCFLDNPSVEALVRGMRTHRPTVFISVPKKWIQLHEAIAQLADPVSGTDEELLAATRNVTGGQLSWGLSAAGYLDPDIFSFFQRQGVELLSGFGMTEATGGITMTPPGQYRENSLGVPLPGIECRLDEDGEMLIRGGYVMRGYFDPPDGEPSFDEDGWFRTGDLMEMDREGHFRLVDRKKEIYKNIKGETVAPQRVENLFRDLESVSRAFLVGDHREYNTLLIYPNPEYEGLDFASLPEEEVHEHFRSLVVSVNKFLSPFERIVDFAIIPRDLDADQGELTAKGTPRRTTVARSFDDVIQTLYRRTSLQVGGVEITLPNWLFQALGLTARHFTVGERQLLLTSSGAALTVRREDPETVQIGSGFYRHTPGPLDLGALLSTPRLWLGNEELLRFVDIEQAARQRPGRREVGLEWIGRPEPYRAEADDEQKLETAVHRVEWALPDLDLAARMLAAEAEEHAVGAVRLFERILDGKEGALAEPARLVLGRATTSESTEVRRRAFQVLVRAERESRFPDTLRRFLAGPTPVLDNETRAELCEQDLSEPRLAAFVAAAQEACTADGSEDAEQRAASVLAFIGAYGAAHPARYHAMRAFLVRMSLLASAVEVRRQAEEAVESMQAGFRQWLEPTARLAVDPETGREYRWDDVVAFDEAVPEEDRTTLLGAIKNTALLREAVFLFSKGALIGLSDIPPGGVWVRLLGARHGKSVYRVTVQTRFRGGYDLAINVNHELSPQQVLEEIHWLILSGDSGGRPPLVEEFGGYWPEQDLWSEEFIAGDTLARGMRRLSKRKGQEERFKQLWPFLSWTALSAYVDFWHRSGRRWEIADPSMTNVVVPTDDYLTGVRIVSVTARRPHAGLLGMLSSFREEFIEPAEKLYPDLAGLVGWDIVFSSVLEVIGEENGLALLEELMQREKGSISDGLRRELEEYVSSVRVRGFLPRRLFFAAKRFRRWDRLSPEATAQARARTLTEFYDTYALARLTQDYPQTRVRFFRETVFRDSPEPLAEGLEGIIKRMRERDLVGDELIDAVAELRSKLELGPEEDYFLARLSLPYLRPEDSADFVSGHLGDQQSEIVVAFEDLDGNAFRVRHALSPKEVERLHRLFLTAKLEVRFRLEHRYLVASSDRGMIIGGIYYEIDETGQTAHLEKIVVAESYRRKGVADRLMKELFNRLSAAGVKAVTTGFFRPQYFYSYGFNIEKRYAGLVKQLAAEKES